LRSSLLVWNQSFALARLSYPQGLKPRAFVSLRVTAERRAFPLLWDASEWSMRQ
jgi:hypothetical protein